MTSEWITSSDERLEDFVCIGDSQALIKQAAITMNNALIWRNKRLEPFMVVPPKVEQ
jgi:hypothetical protein